MPTLPDGTPLPYPDEEPQASPLQAVQDAIQGLHDLMAVLPDAKHTQAVGKALMALLPVQQEIMGAQQPADPRQQLIASLGG